MYKKIVELEKDFTAFNQVGRTIQELKMETKRDMKLSGSPTAFWCYYIECQSELMPCCAQNTPNLHGMVPRLLMYKRVRTEVI